MFLVRERDVRVGPPAEETLLHQVSHLGGVPGRDQVDLGRESQLLRTTEPSAHWRGVRCGGIGRKRKGKKYGTPVNKKGGKTMDEVSKLAINKIKRPNF